MAFLFRRWKSKKHVYKIIVEFVNKRDNFSKFLGFFSLDLWTFRIDVSLNLIFCVGCYSALLLGWVSMPFRHEGCQVSVDFGCLGNLFSYFTGMAGTLEKKINLTFWVKFWHENFQYISELKYWLRFKLTCSTSFFVVNWAKSISRTSLSPLRITTGVVGFIQNSKS